MVEASSIEVRPLTRERLPDLVAGLIALDAAVRTEFGAAYSTERWDSEEFAMSLHGKFIHSAVAFLSGELVGFWVASVQGLMLYTHRVAVDRHSRGEGVGHDLFEYVRDGALSGGLRWMGLSVSVHSPAIPFYEARGFRRTSGEVLRDFMEKRGSHLPVGEDHYETPDGDRNALYVLELGKDSERRTNS